MEYNFSNRIKDLDGTATREIFKLLSRSEIVSFAGGLPANEYLPVEIIKNICDKILTDPNALKSLQYGTTEGFNYFREELVKYVGSVGIENININNTLVVSGGQQGIDLCIKSFVNKGDVVLVEDPTYLAFLQILSSYEGKAVGVKATNEGLDLTDLENKIIKYKPKMLYCVPTFSNPTGKTYSLENRQKIAEISAKYNIMVVEDDPYSKLRYEGEGVKALKSFDKIGNVIYITSFSKVLSPGLRIGVAVGDEKLIRKLTIAKQGVDLHSSNLSQLIAYEYLKQGFMPKNIEKSIPLYLKRKNAMIDALDKYMPSEFTHTNPSGGLFIWGKFDAPLNTKEILKEAIEYNVAYIQGGEFYADKQKGLNAIRLNFSNESIERIDSGIKSLSELYKKKIMEAKR